VLCNDVEPAVPLCEPDFDLARKAGLPADRGQIQEQGR
jgi:hypothetical protein